MTTLEDMAVLFVVLGPAIALGWWLRNRIGARPLGGAVVVGCAVVGIVLGTLALRYVDERRDSARLDHVLEHMNDQRCAEPPSRDPRVREMQELMCTRGARHGRLEADGVVVGVVVTGDLAGVPLPRVPAGASYVVWLLDAAGQPVAHLAIAGDVPFAAVRDRRIAAATEAIVTVESTIGPAPTSPALARARLQ